ncbi:unnamed protein product [Cyprideis torosa]|uniref:AB hydrolase-1 domain-containing protein n=1 Tax=Cyprideis torosa TaxID=163714 RepID=A0A7R8WFM1_9CRUS|nr:unnamed protein product [Cyprideis torosa]CAG0895568.1 unnamed protein product [Cyprideis torosa]
MSALRAVERQILSFLKNPYHGSMVPILSPMRGKEVKSEVWTITLKEKSQGNPLVLLHGFASGSALWTLNLDQLACLDRPVIAVDLLGFGRSSRPKFSKEAEAVELEWVESLEAWRAALKVNSMVLIGHSLGGYLASSYAIRYPQHIEHLVLVDPWGFPAKPDNAITYSNLPLRARAIVKILSSLNPLTLLRAAGPFGPSLVQKFRPDLVLKFSRFIDASLLFKYIYLCNSSTPSGEIAFKVLLSEFGWAKRPMLPRLMANLPLDMKVTFIYGASSWIKPDSGEAVRNQRPGHVKVHVIPDTSHHVYIDDPDAFIKCIADVCDVEIHLPKRLQFNPNEGKVPQ